MVTSEICLICDAPLTSPRKALVAPFLARRIWGEKPFRASLASCASCGFCFFNPRFEPQEATALYKNYRDDQYFRLRHEYEPWYTQEFNKRLQGNPELLAFRRQQITRIVSKYADSQKITSMLDFGGDRGQLIQGLLSGSRHVYDISGVEAVSGVERVAKLAEVPQGWDLIVCSHVLEHVSSPVDVLHEMRQSARKDTLVVLEVPFESPFALTSLGKRLAQFVVLSAMRGQYALQMLDSGLIYVMHEHVNFFSLSSLETLFRKTGFRLLGSGVYPVPFGKLYRPRTFWCAGSVSI